MAVFFFLAAALPYLLAVLLTLALTAVTGLAIWFLNGGRWWAWLAGLAVGLAGSCVSPLLQRLEGAGIDAAVAAAELQPSRLELEPGALVHLQDGNHYGITCRRCDFAGLPFVTDAETVSLYPALIDHRGELVERSSLNAPTPDRTERGQFRYAFISAPPVWWEDAPFEPPAWYPRPVPPRLKGVHMLVALPPTGIVRPADLKPLYLRINRQYELQVPFSWGLVTETVVRPTPEEIFSDLAARVTAK